MSDLGIGDSKKANWAVAYADQTRKRYLGPALRRAYKKDGSPPDRDALVEAIAEAKGILSALERGLEMLGDDRPGNGGHPCRPHPTPPSQEADVRRTDVSWFECPHGHQFGVVVATEPKQYVVKCPVCGTDTIPFSTRWPYPTPVPPLASILPDNPKET